MALHGSVYLTSPDINGQSDENTAFLKALEAGTALKYAFGFENAGELSDTLADEYSYIDFGLCKASALKNIKFRRSILPPFPIRKWSRTSVYRPMLPKRF